MFLLAGGGEGSWLSYPGLEAWKFVNLFIFLTVLIFVLRSKISTALQSRRASIQQELTTAQQEREQALARIAEADTLLGRLDDDIRTVREQAKQEAESERKRVAAATEREMEKLQQQAQREMERADKLARKELREYLAKRSIEVARDTVRTQMSPEDDTHLIKENIGDLRRTTV